MLQKTADYMKKQKMAFAGEKIVLGLSGGIDSVCLFHILRELGYPLEAVHVHHGIRGAEADRDEAFAKALCKKFHIPFHGYAFDVPKISRERHLSVEETGRLLRRQAFTEVMEKTGAKKIALAHHGNDQAETFLFHLSRGTGLKGLSAMKPADGVYIRPLLWAERREIEAYAGKMGYEYVEDGTNASEEYTRNKIRHRILPVLEEVNPKTVSHICRAAEKLQGIQEYIDREAQKLFQDSVRAEEEALFLQEQPFLKADPVIQMPVLQKCVECMTGSLVDITEEHLQKLLCLFGLQTGKEVHLPKDLTAVRTYDGIRLFFRQEFVVPEPVMIPLDGVCRFGDLTVQVTVEDWEEGKNIPIKTYTKCFDYDKITENVFLRTRKIGDFLEINKEHGKKSIQDYLVNEKVPKEKRDQVVLLAEGSHVLWVVGKRISEYYKVTEKTKKVLKVQVNGGNVHEEFYS